MVAAAATGTLAGSASLVVLSLWGRRSPARSVGSLADYSFAALAATMASPIVWTHHYGILLPVFAFVLPACLERGPRGPSLFLLAVAFTLWANMIVAAGAVASVPVLNLLQSYVFAAACIMLWILHRLRSEDGTAQPAEDCSHA